jgi:hypothetical protein
MFYRGYRRVIVHCGLHKTGSSYLQRLFLANQDVLRRKSVYFPDFRNPEIAAHNKGNHSEIAVSYDPPLGAEANLSRFVDLASGCDTLLISGEEFSRVVDIPGFIGGLKQFAPRAELSFIFYLRRFDHMIESVYSESVKASLVGDISRAHYQLDYGATIAAFVEALGGTKQIIIRPYNRALWFNGDLAADFFSTSGLKAIYRSLRPVEPANRSMSRMETFLLSLIKTRRAKQRTVGRLAAIPLASYSNPGRFFRSAEDRQRLNAAFTDSAQRLADTFRLGDIDHFLDLKNFKDDPDWTPFEPDWIALSSYLVGMNEEMADAL